MVVNTSMGQSAWGSKGDQSPIPDITHLAPCDLQPRVGNAQGALRISQEQHLRASSATTVLLGLPLCC